MDSTRSPMRAPTVPITPARSPARVRDRLEQVRDGRLPVRAGDAEHPQRVRRVAVEAGRERSEHARTDADARLRDVERQQSSTSSATAPARTAAAAWSWPSVTDPGCSRTAHRGAPRGCRARRRRRPPNRPGRGAPAPPSRRAPARSARRSCSCTVLLIRSGTGRAAGYRAWPARHACGPR